jgi:hypothetical protein
MLIARAIEDSRLARLECCDNGVGERSRTQAATHCTLAQETVDARKHGLRVQHECAYIVVLGDRKVDVHYTALRPTVPTAVGA